ncbi:hypothetical protein C8R44DRAFT_858750 [Mycena epipterygia]|nr:hypothetical protein C8R44DRAFT_858750 [Mycena epipterygia]
MATPVACSRPDSKPFLLFLLLLLLKKLFMSKFAASVDMVRGGSRWLPASGSIVRCRRKGCPRVGTERSGSLKCLALVQDLDLWLDDSWSNSEDPLNSKYRLRNSRKMGGRRKKGIPFPSCWQQFIHDRGGCTRTPASPEPSAFQDERKSHPMHIDALPPNNVAMRWTKPLASQSLVHTESTVFLGCDAAVGLRIVYNEA